MMKESHPEQRFTGEQGGREEEEEKGDQAKP